MEFDEVLIFSVADGSLQASSDVPQSADEFDRRLMRVATRDAGCCSP